ncbi:MAG: acetyltransferase [Clostridia bacterium]|jgi:RimJ/RimL family protein N-acetyltransferase|nr:acetyltransferase [Clostridia bacterium]
MYTGQKVRLRAYTREDISIRLNYINDIEIANLLTADIPYPILLHEEEKWFESITSQSDRYMFAIETIEDNRFIGGCSINSIDWKNSVATVGIFIGHKDYWGHGYGNDAMNILISFIFNQMNINKIRLISYSFNKRAIKSFEKCGFVIEGILRKEVFKDGIYYDKIAMGILREEFLKNMAADK